MHRRLPPSAPAIDRLKTKKDPQAQKSLLLLLWYAQEAKPDEAIQAFQNDSSQPEEIRQYARHLRETEKRFKTDPSLSKDEAQLRSKRQKRMYAVSDEALSDLDQFTMQLNVARRK